MIELFQLGRFDEAWASCMEVLSQNKTHGEALNLAGAIALKKGHLSEAISYLEQAILHKPEKRLIYSFNLALAHVESGQLNAAIQVYKTIAEQSKITEDICCAYESAGKLLAQQEEYSEAALCFQKASTCMPNRPELLNYLGISLNQCGRIAESIKSYEQALLMCPNFPEVHYNLGLLMREEKRLEKAENHFRKALELAPTNIDILYNLAGLLGDSNRSQEAIDLYLSILDQHPQAGVYQHLYFHLRRTCQWAKAREIAHLVTEDPPFNNILRCMDPAKNLLAATAYASKLKRTHFDTRHRLVPKEKLTIGYLSSDIHNHATAHLMLSLFGLHDKEKFNIYMYSYGPEDSSLYRRRIQNDCTRFFDIRKYSEESAARKIFDDEVDILVDLKGFTQGNRLGICAYRPAPVQMTYLGFPGTSGADFFDYVITDKIVSPPDESVYYSEKLLYMPHSYQVNDYRQPISPKLFTRQDFGLPAQGLIMASFNNPVKIEEEVFNCWMRLLKRIPGSVLWMQVNDAFIEKNLVQHALAQGVSGERIVFAKMLPKDEHLARIQLADLVLDTRIYNGHTTTSDALWAGVPVVAITGTHFASRVSASLLTHVGLEELITETLEAYEELGYRLGTYPEELRMVRKKLAAKRESCALFNTPRFARDLEDLFLGAWANQVR